MKTTFFLLNHIGLVDFLMWHSENFPLKKKLQGGTVNSPKNISKGGHSPPPPQNLCPGWNLEIPPLSSFNLDIFAYSLTPRPGPAFHTKN